MTRAGSQAIQHRKADVAAIVCAPGSPAIAVENEVLFSTPVFEVRRGVALSDATGNLTALIDTGRQLIDLLQRDVDPNPDDVEIVGRAASYLLTFASALSAAIDFGTGAASTANTAGG